jgi:hypothetical protein
VTTTLTHQKNPAVGWDVSASAKADKGEKIVRAQIIVDDFPEYDKTFDEPLSSWQQQLTQQGQYPGENTIRLVITNDQGEDTDAEDSWG